MRKRGRIPFRTDKPFRMAAIIAIPTIALCVFAGNAITQESGKFFSDVSEMLPAPVVVEEAPESTDINVINTTTQIPAYLFVQNVVQTFPTGFSGPSLDDAGTPNNALAWVCNYSTTPAPVLASSLSFSPEKSSFTIQVLGAGQGATAIESARSKVSHCIDRGGNGGISTNNSPIDSAQGFIGYYSSGSEKIYVSVWQRGDVLLSVASPSQDNMINIANQYDTIVTNALTGQCSSLNVSLEDAKRSPYYDAANYTGWPRGREVILDINTIGLSAGKLSSTQEIVGDGLPHGLFAGGVIYPVDGTPSVAPDWSKVKLPTSPLPPIVPIGLPAAIVEPSDEPVAPTAPETKTTIPERVLDDIGPGCGWAFTGQSMPIYDDAIEKKRADDATLVAQAQLQKNAADYAITRQTYVTAFGTYSASVNSYNAYAAEVNSVREQWDSLTHIRTLYRTKLDSYLASITANTKFIADKAAAQLAYDGELATCVIQDNAKAEEAKKNNNSNSSTKNSLVAPEPNPTAIPSPTPTPTPTATPTPIVPEIICPPVRPVILDEVEPKILPIPARPDVPLPDAWTDVPAL